MASGIFYMFQSLATNDRLIHQSGNASTITIVFHLGSILLGVITFFYLLYANSFLMNLKRKEYGMLLMLGASKSKIIFLNFLETIGIGLVSTLAGNLVGFMLSKIVTLFLQNILDTELMANSLVNLKAFLISLVFFVICFFLTAIVNGSSLAKQQLINLMKKQATPDFTDSKLWYLVLQFISGSFCLGLGYYAMYHVLSWKVKAVVIAMITIFLGSYLIIHSCVILILSFVKQRKNYYFKEMNAILVAQIEYRIKSYTQILTVIAMLFALALGAFTVGLDFGQEAYKSADKAFFYDLILTQENSHVLNQLDQNNIKSKTAYRFKAVGEHVLINKGDFDKRAFIVNGPISAQGDVVQKSFNGSAMEKSEIAQKNFSNMLPEALQDKKIFFVSQEEFGVSNGVTQALVLVKTKNFKKNYEMLASIVKEIEPNKNLDFIFLSAQKVHRYQAHAKGFVGFQYMGFFLGLAFLTMLTSCLMFKILTSYKTDQERYKILLKIGANKSGINRVIQKELLVVFAIAAFLGTLHVLFGLQLFKVLLTNPYDSIALPITGFLMIYFVYFYLTYKMYSKIIFS